MYYDIVIGLSTQRLSALSALLKKIEKQAHEKDMSDEEVLSLRLAPDMFPLKKQVQVATDNAK